MKYLRYGEKETVAHVVSCQDELAIQAFQNLVEHLNKWKVKSNMAPKVFQAVKQALLSWKKGILHLPGPLISMGFVDAFQAWEWLRWQAFLEG